MSNTHEEWPCGCEFLNNERTKACDDHRNFKPSVTGFVGTDIHVSKKEHDQVVYDRDFFEAERDALRLALKAVRADLADRDRTIYELNCSVQEAKRERDDVRKARGFTERERDAALEMVAQRDRRIAEFEAALHKISGQPCHWEANLRRDPCTGGLTDCDPCLARAALYGPAQPAKEHCPRRLMGETLAPHAPCDTGDHSRDAQPATAAKHVNLGDGSICNCATVPRAHLVARHIDCEYYNHHCANCHEDLRCTHTDCLSAFLGDAAPPSPAAREAIGELSFTREEHDRFMAAVDKLPVEEEQCEGCGHVPHRSSCATVLPGDLGNVCGCNAVISSNRNKGKK